MDQIMNYGLDPAQLRKHIIVPVLDQLALGGNAAISLVLGTAMHESHLQYLKQMGGPALGLWQMEPDTHHDCWNNFLNFRRDLAARVRAIAGGVPRAEEMIGNLNYACAMARVKYRRVPGGMPHNDPHELAVYWKEHYNTSLGKGTIAQALPHFTAAVKLTL
jgi:hypothetical protein